MELFVLFLIVAVGGVWWLNHVMNKKAIEAAQKKLEDNEQSAPYKVEEPIVSQEQTAKVVEPTKCGCGRSPTGFCVGLHKLTADEWAVHADNPNKQSAESKPVKKPRKPATKTAAVSKARTKRPVATKTASKKVKK